MAIVVREPGEAGFSRDGQCADSSAGHGAEKSFCVGTRTRVPPLEPGLGNGPLCSGDGLIAACRELTTVAGRNSILESLPRLAMGICVARAAQLLEIEAGTTALVATHGLPLATDTQRTISGVRSIVDAPCTVDAYRRAVDSDPGEDPVHAAAESRIAIPIRCGSTSRFLLVLDKEPGATFTPEEIRQLAIFVFLSSAVLARASSDAALQASRATESALVEAIHDAVIAFDANGMVRALSSSAASLIGRPKKEIIGRRLLDLPGLAPMALSLQGERWPDTVKLSLRATTARVLRCEGGLSIALLAVADGTPLIDAAHFHIDDLLGESPPIVRAREMAQRVANSHLPILLTGETGTGKEIVAQAIHNLSARAHEPFVAVNVSAIPRELLESELFGYDAGAFTGASPHGHTGKVELARSGTLLLDEVADMPLEMQAKLLRILQERVVYRLGAARPYPFTARVIASTNRDLEHEVREGRFRVDLLHRLRGVHIELPPLRERSGDVRLLVAHQLRVLAEGIGRQPIEIAPVVLAELETYDWPGNARELVNMLECEVSLLPPGKNIIDVVPQAIERSKRHLGTTMGTSGTMTLDSAQREACIHALETTSGNVARAARILGVAKGTLYSKIRRYGIAQAPTRLMDPGPRGPARH